MKQVNNSVDRQRVISRLKNGVSQSPAAIQLANSYSITFSLRKHLLQTESTGEGHRPFRPGASAQRLDKVVHVTYLTFLYEYTLLDQRVHVFRNIWC